MRFRWSNRRQSSRICSQTLLGFEPLENRHLLSVSADIVFVVDESLSDETASVQAWLASIVDDLDAALQTANVNAQYGLVGVGESTPPPANVARYGHSQLVGGELFTDNHSELVTGIDNLKNIGGEEDGWDAIEHAILEYPIRNGAIPDTSFCPRRRVAQGRD